MIQLPIKNYYLVEVPMESGKIVLQGYNLTELYNTVTHKTCGWFKPLQQIGPRSYYRLISDNIANITEEVAKGMGTSLAELHSAFDSTGVVWRNKYGKEYPDTRTWKWQGNGYLWKEAQSLVKRFVLIEKEVGDE